jgi:hypothetical protein
MGFMGLLKTQNEWTFHKVICIFITLMSSGMDGEEEDIRLLSSFLPPLSAISSPCPNSSSSVCLKLSVKVMFEPLPLIAHSCFLAFFLAFFFSFCRCLVLFFDSAIAS